MASNVSSCWQSHLLVLETLTVSRRNVVLGSDLEVSVAAVALVDGTLGVGSAALALAKVHLIVHQLVGILLLGVRVVEVGNAEADLDELVLELAAELDDLLASNIVELPVGPGEEVLDVAVGRGLARVGVLALELKLGGELRGELLSGGVEGRAGCAEGGGEGAGSLCLDGAGECRADRGAGRGRCETSSCSRRSAGEGAEGVHCVWWKG